MDGNKPSPVKSRPNSAASTPKIPVRSSVIEKSRKHSKNNGHEHLPDHGSEKATLMEHDSIIRYETSDEYKERVQSDTVEAGPSQIDDSQPQHLQESPSRSLVSDYEERETCCTYKVRNSFILCCGFLCFGASMAIMGPTILELGCLIGSDVGSMSWVFFSQSCSALFGAICSGFIIDRY